MTPAAIIQLAGIALRMLHEAPEAIDDIAALWHKIASAHAVPPHVEAAMNTALDVVRQANGHTA